MGVHVFNFLWVKNTKIEQKILSDDKTKNI